MAVAVVAAAVVVAVEIKVVVFHTTNHNQPRAGLGSLQQKQSVS